MKLSGSQYATIRFVIDMMEISNLEIDTNKDSHRRIIQDFNQVSKFRMNDVNSMPLMVNTAINRSFVIACHFIVGCFDEESYDLEAEAESVCQVLKDAIYSDSIDC